VSRRIRSLKAFGLCVALVAVGTWPLIWPAGGLVQRNADAYGSAWLIWAAGSQQTVQSLQWADTLLFGLFAYLAAPLGAVAGYHLLTLIGVLASVVVTEQVALRVFEVRRPASLIAGFAFGLSPLAGTGLAEGHGGLLFGVGLPLLLGALEVRPGNRPWRWAFLVVAAGCLCALQSGYFAVMAALVVAVYGAARRRPLWRIACVAVLPALAYWGVVFGGLDSASASERVTGLVSVSAAADTLAGIPPGFDLNWYHVRFPLLWTLLAFGLVLPLARREGPDVALVLVALCAVGLSLGDRAYLTTFPGEFAEMRTGSPWGWIRHWAPPLKLFRFPSRFLWVWYLAGGMAAARLASWLLPGRSGWLVALVAGETLLVGMRPLEPRRTLAQVPSAYQVLEPEDTVLDLWPWYPNSISLPVLNINCYYQTQHEARLPYPCLTVSTPQSPLRAQVDGLVAAILANSPTRAMAIMQKDGISHVAWHSDAFETESRARVGRVLEHWWGPRLAKSRDGGETIVMYRVGTAEPAPESPRSLPIEPAQVDRNCPDYAMCRVRPTTVVEPPDPLPLVVLPAMAGVGLLLLPLAVRRRRRSSPSAE
jgi:hypothetical protein